MRASSESWRLAQVRPSDRLRAGFVAKAARNAALPGIYRDESAGSFCAKESNLALHRFAAAAFRSIFIFAGATAFSAIDRAGRSVFRTAVGSTAGCLQLVLAGIGATTGGFVILHAFRGFVLAAARFCVIVAARSRFFSVRGQPHLAGTALAIFRIRRRHLGGTCAFRLRWRGTRLWSVRGCGLGPCGEGQDQHHDQRFTFHIEPQ